MFGTIGIISSRPADLDAAPAEIERLRRQNIAFRVQRLALSELPIPKALVQITGNAPSSEATATPSGISVCMSLPSKADLARRLADMENQRDWWMHLAIMRGELLTTVGPLPSIADADEVLSDFWNCPVGEALPITTAPNTPAADPVAVPDPARAAGADEVLSDFRDCLVGEALPVGVHYAWVLPQMDGKKAIVARQPSDDLPIPPVPFNALRWSR